MSGTPRTLKDAIRQAICIGPMSNIEAHSHVVLRDFISQKFQAVLIKAENKETEKMLLNLFKELTG